ncbi:hypothetical protein JCGZ_01217 [Jatropha curcas]|uniref:Peptide N-acetyl-beta-D-glucosaminyl asparaginase amidase A N-terminal domain-containing protein n=1 Tax=Jatropha curcas TaxID=180498 RepID=A0A067L8L3_JATCU|nr:hypothetical protein JCGZ_01217 [Jatropha curcas]
MLLPVINTSFTNTTKYLFSAVYSPPSDCFPPWTYVVLNLHAGCSNDMPYHIFGLWLGGVELLRTSAPKLTTKTSRNLWGVRKDITRFQSFIQFEKNGTYKFVKLKTEVQKELQVPNDREELLNRIESCSNCNNLSSFIDNKQISNGWLPIPDQQQPSLAGDASTEQRLRYEDGFICYSRAVTVVNGILSTDDLSYGCISSS